LFTFKKKYIILYLLKVDGFMVETHQAFIGDTGSHLLKNGVWQGKARETTKEENK